MSSQDVNIPATGVGLFQFFLSVNQHTKIDADKWVSKLISVSDMVSSVLTDNEPIRD